MIDLRGDGFRFTSAERGVYFDFYRNLSPHERLGWTTAGEDDVFLALDRDNDGQITFGAELFGNLTPQPKTDEPNGYNALSEYDTLEFEGNEDGKIDTEDRIFPRLLAWHDRNHNGISEQDEFYRLDQLGIDAIYLDYYRSSEQDEHGNELRYFGRVCLGSDAPGLPPPSYSLEARSDTEGSVLDPLQLRQGELTASDCEGRIVQSTDVFFVREIADRSQ